MSVEIEKDGHVWTVIHNRPETTNAVDPQAAEDLVAAFLEFDRKSAAGTSAAMPRNTCPVTPRQRFLQAEAQHLGRTTQVWGAVVSDEASRRAPLASRQLRSGDGLRWRGRSSA